MTGPLFDTVIVGDLKLAATFDKFPDKAHDLLLSRIRSLTDRLEQMVKAAAPFRTGKLRNQSIQQKIYDDRDRLRGRVTVIDDFAKAATLEYGSHRSIRLGLGPGPERRKQSRQGVAKDLARPTAQFNAAFGRQTNIVGFRYLRGPLAALAVSSETELRAAIAEAVALANSEAGI